MPAESPFTAAAIPATLALGVGTVAGLAVLGLGAGVLGGLAGVGGSMLMLPGLHWILGDEPPAVHHLYIASAFIVNVVVAFPASRRHAKSGALRRDLLPVLIASTMGAMIAGVLLGSVVNGQWLAYALAGFMLLYCAFNVWRVVGQHPEPSGDHARTEPWRLGACGVVTGMVGGLLGLAGGVVLVPLLQLVCGLGLRASIATSSAVVWMTAGVGACVKMGAVLWGPQAGIVRWQDVLVLSAVMAPTALIGSQIGASLTHRLPVRVVRVAITIILLVAAAKLLDLL